MGKILPTILSLLCCFHSLFSDSLIITGYDSEGRAVYWTLETPGTPSSSILLDQGTHDDASVRAVAYAPSLLAYLGGEVWDDETTTAAYWTVPFGGSAGPLQLLADSSDSAQVEIDGIAFNPAGIGYMVGSDSSGAPAYWTISTLGVVSNSTALDTDGFATAVAFSSTGKGYIVGANNVFNTCYWTMTPEGVVSGPYELSGGESGGAASAYDVAVTPSGTAYIVGANTGSVACYWTISPEGIASGVTELPGTSTNSQGRGVAFLPSGEGIIVGQSSGNVACYWTITDQGVIGTATALPNGFGSSSSAYDVVFGSDGTAYIAGADQSFQATLWTLANLAATPQYSILQSGGIGLANSLAIYFPVNPAPPTDLTGRKILNDFGWVYEYAALLSWTASPTPGVVSYAIYKDDILIATVASSITNFLDHNVKKSLYAVKAVDSLGRESDPVTLYIK